MTAPLIPSENTTLVALKAAWPQRDAQDRPSPERIVDRIEDDGIRWRALSIEEVVERLIEQCEGEVSA